MVWGFFHSIKHDVGKAGAGSNKKPRTCVRGFLAARSVLNEDALCAVSANQKVNPIGQVRHVNGMTSRC